MRLGVGALESRGLLVRVSCLLTLDSGLEIGLGTGLTRMATATSAAGETEHFWGLDHIGQVVDFLGLDRSAETGGWRALL